MALAEIAGLIAVFDDRVVEGRIVMFVAPSAVVGYLVLGPMWMKLAMVCFRIAENVQTTADRG